MDKVFDWLMARLGELIAWAFDGWIMWAVAGAIVGVLSLLVWSGLRMSSTDRLYANGLRAAGYHGRDEVELIPKPANESDADERPTETVPVVRGTVQSFMIYPDGSGEGVDLTEFVTGVSLGVSEDTGDDLTPTEETDDGTSSHGPEDEGDQDRDSSRYGGSIPEWEYTGDPEPGCRIFVLPSPGDPEPGRESGRDDLLHTDHGHVATNGPDKLQRVGYGPWVQYIGPGEYNPYRQFE